MKKNKRVFLQKKSRAYILPGIGGVAKAYTYSMTPVFKGINFGSTMVLMENGDVSWYALEEKMKEVADKALLMVKKDPDCVFRIRKKFEKMIADFVGFTARVFNTDPARLSKAQIWKILDKYFQLYPRVYAWGEPIVLALEESLGTLLKDYLKGIMKDSQDVKSLTEIYNALISPQEKSFVKKEEEDLLKIVREIQKNKEVKRIFTGKGFSSKKLREKFPGIYNRIKKHEADYCWVPYDYGVYLWDLKYFLKVIKDLVSSRNAGDDLEKNKRYYQALAKKRRDLVKKLKIDAYHQKLFSVLRTSAFLLDYKKEQFTKCHYQIMSLFREVAKRLKISETHIRIYTPEELKQFLLHNKALSGERLKSRYAYAAYYWYGNKFKLYENKEARTFFDREVRKESREEARQFEGIIASAGKYVGRARVISHPRELNNFKKGEILVAQMTSPEYVVAMKKAGAIITDRGGVTCHAAVVSRELGVPCVVGTGNATKILKTGDLVELNANHNSVRIIKR